MSFYPELEYNGNIQKVIGVQFSLMSPEEIRRRSVVEIKNADTFISGNIAVPNGLFDISMGVLENGILCSTDKLDNRLCPGYFGHIELATPVFYIHFMKYILKTLSNICYRCADLLLSEDEKLELKELIVKKKGYRRFLFVRKFIQEKNTKTVSKVIHCRSCNSIQPEKYIREELNICIYEVKSPGEIQQKEKIMLPPEYVMILFKKITDENCEMMGFSSKYSRPEWMICQVLPVCPPAVRPSVKMDNSQRMEDDLTHKLIDIVKENRKLRENKVHYSSLQFHVATLIDNDNKSIPKSTQRTGRPLKSIRQRLKGKEGRIRNNLMGKRVDFSARTVITPDPLLKIDELGVPTEMCINLTYPERVTLYNIHRLQEMVNNGPSKYPGAKSVKHGTRYISLLHSKRQLQLGDIVNRHLMKGDVVLFNRQPSLHKMSMMAHRVCPIPSRTFRLSVDVTTPYNADFDGDEMNMHVPQSIESVVELECLASVPYQLISPAKNEPIVYVVQDSCLGLYLLTRDNTISFPKRHVMNFLMACNDYRIHDVCTMNDVFSHDILNCIMPSINLYTNNGIDSKYHQTKGGEDPNIIHIQNGKFVKRCGIIDKTVFKKSSKGFVHVAFNDCSPSIARDLIDNVRFIITNYLLYQGFSVGISDLILHREKLQEISSIILSKKEEVNQLLQSVHNQDFRNDSTRSNSDYLESQIQSILQNKLFSETSHIILESLSGQTNRFMDMYNAKSKGSNVNISQMISNVGQIIVDGQRIKYGFTDRTLPHFCKFDDSAEARGFVENSFVSGLSPHEFFFHAMGGREGLIDTAVKTSKTGYIQRRLIKTLEDLKVMYDGTVRDANNNVVQFCYGEDGFDACKIENVSLFYLSKSTMEIQQEFLMKDYETEEERTRHYHHFVNTILGFKSYYIDVMCKGLPPLKQGVLLHFPVNFERTILNIKTMFHLHVKEEGGRSSSANAKSRLSVTYILDKIDEVVDRLNPSDVLCRYLLNIYLSPKRIMERHGFTKEAFDHLLDTIEHIYRMSLVQPGEMVGAIAAQSIGEPTTQMTLNTFHFAGVGEKLSVNKGVPRLEELFSISRFPKNPSMEIYPSKIMKSSSFTLDQNKVVSKELMDNLELTTLGQLVIKSRVLYEAKDDSSILYIQQIRQALLGSSSSSSSPRWILVLELDHSKMMTKNISCIEIEYAILSMKYSNQMDANEDLEVYIDNENHLADGGVLNVYITFRRITHISSKYSKRVSSTPALSEPRDKLELLKMIEKYIMEKIILRGIPELKKISMFKSKLPGYYNEVGIFDTPDVYLLETLGSNFLDVLIHPFVDKVHTITNNIHEIYEILGIEAARYALCFEIYQVIKDSQSYWRHIGLLVDAMTNRGVLISVDRRGMNRGDIGPLAKSSFEETDQMLYQAAVFGELDNVKGVSSNIMLGQVPPCGTGVVDILLDEKELQSYYHDPQWKSFYKEYIKNMNKYQQIGLTPFFSSLEEQAQAQIPMVPVECTTGSFDFDFNPELM